ncbi:hypothetical protein GCM10010123_39010 [Pilimelia anulata]|uniref:Uncharacterized protein n=1 Tax=Pilimelia anulata TaxID=53371 RepID=A0A8J3B9F4_9ACTN|nr:hypothetical protein [Pilimelia anulata]GGK05341.1 hypothetical protein GCM10010123_39010 [Pilimelia anulata]
MLFPLVSTEVDAALPAAIATAGGTDRLNATARDFLDVVAAALPGAPRVADHAHRRPDPAAVRALSPATRRRIIRTAIALNVLTEQPDAADHARIAAAAADLDVAEPAVDVIAALAAGTVPLTLVHTVEFDAYRTPVPRDLALLPAYARFLAMHLPPAAIHGTLASPELAAQFAPLHHLPADTAGRTFADFYAAHDWRLPGVPGAVALPLTLHDWLHVYIGATTEPLGEVEVGAFAAGTTRHPYGFHNLLIVLLMFEHGMVDAMNGGPGLAPAGAGAARPLSRERARGITGNPAGGAMVADAFLRGTATNTDLYLGVDHLGRADTPLAELREEYAIPARGTYAAALTPALGRA